MQKRGQIKTLWAVIGAVLAAVIIIFFTFVILAFTGIFTGPSASEQAAVNNFKVLGDILTKFLEHKGVFASETIQFNIPNGYILVGFDKDWHGDSPVNTDSENPKNDKIEANWCSDGEGIAKPTSCLGQACICLYEETSAGDDFMEEGRNPDDLVLPCIKLGDVVISGPRDSEADRFYDGALTGRRENNGLNDGAKKYPHPNYGPLGAFPKYEFLVIYGECDEVWGIKSLYVEKYKDMDTNEIYLFVADKSEEIQNREKEMREEIARKIYVKAKKEFFDQEKFDDAVNAYEQLVLDLPETTSAVQAKADIARIGRIYYNKAVNDKSEELFNKSIRVYEQMHILELKTEVADQLRSVFEDQYRLDLGKIYSSPDYTYLDYGKAIEYLKALIDDPKAKESNKNAAKQEMKRIAERTGRSFDSKYLP